MKAIEDEADAVEKALSKWADEVSSLGDMYAELITRYSKALAEDRGIPDDQIRFVFLIDDLDRCLPEVAVSVLEKINNFLCVSQCVYVLGLNPIIIYQGIRSKYPNMEIDGREYIEKILNYSYFVPEANIEAVSQFTSSCFKTLLLDTDDMKSHHDRFELFGKTLSSSNFTNPRR